MATKQEWIKRLIQQWANEFPRDIIHPDHLANIADSLAIRDQMIDEYRAFRYEFMKCIERKGNN